MSTKTLTVISDVENNLRTLSANRAESFSTCVLKEVLAAIESKVKPQYPVNKDVTPIRFYVTSAYKEYFEDYEADWIAAKLNAYILKGRQSEPDHAIAIRTTGHGHLFRRLPDNYDRRDEQQRLVTVILDALEKNKYLMAEASTGVGKAMALALVALYQAEKEHRTVIASPTLQILKQTVSEYSNLKNSAPYTVLLGKQEFVSVYALQDLLDEEGDKLPEHEKVQAWIKRRGEPAKGVPLEIDWLLESLYTIAPTFPLHEVCLAYVHEPDISDPGYQSYQACFLQSRDSMVVFCTHAMLAVDVMKRKHALQRDASAKDELSNTIKNILKDRGEQTAEEIASVRGDFQAVYDGVIGPFDTLLVDEAHMLEQIFANYHTSELSLFSLNNSLKKLAKDKDKKILSRLKSITKQIINSKPQNEDKVIITRNSDISKKFTAFYVAAKEILESISSKSRENEYYYRAKSQIKDLGFFLKNTNKFDIIAFVNWSPVKDLPRLSFGKRSLRDEMLSLWQYAKNGALVSATMMLPDTGPFHLQKRLNIPKVKLAVATPIEADWIYRPVSVFTPEYIKMSNNRAWLMPPARSAITSTALDLNRFTKIWINEVSDVISTQIAPSTQGGILCLMTSFESIEKLTNKLVYALPNHEIIAHSLGSNFSELLDHYIEAYINNLNPIFLATGRALTGMDLTLKSVPASRDQLIADLVMPRLPFNMNRSAAHALRTSYSLKEEFDECALLFKQMCGRLVRRNGVKNKRLWVLDSRIAKISDSTTVTHRKLLEKYQNKKIFKQQ